MSFRTYTLTKLVKILMKIYRALFFCFYNANKWNLDERNLQRSIYGMSFVIINIFNTILFMVFANLNLRPNGYMVGGLTILAIDLLYKFNLRYFKNLLTTEASHYHSEKNGKKWLTALCYIILFGSFILLGFSGKYFSNKSKINKLSARAVKHHQLYLLHI